MVTPALSRILLLGFALVATTALADDFMLGPGRFMSDADTRDNTSPMESTAPASGTARVIYHDGHNAPVSVPVNPRGIDGAAAGGSTGADSTTAATATADTADSAVSTTPTRLPSAEPSVPQKPRNGLRWQSVLPGSIK